MTTQLLKRHVRLEYGDALADSVRIDGSVPVMSSGGVTGRHDRANTLGPCIVVGRKGSFGSVHWSQVPAFVIDTAYFIDARTTDVDLRWLYYALQSLDLRGASQDVGVPGLSREAVHALQLVVPAASAQRQIADFLDDQVARIDEIIRLREEQIDSLSAMFRIQIREGVAGVPLTRTPIDTGVPWVGSAHPRAAVQALRRSLILQRGVDLTADERHEGNIPVITTGGHVGNHNRAIADGPGVVIGRYGTVGNVDWIPGPYWPHNTTLYVKDFKGNDRRYIYWLLRAFPYDMQQARSAVPGVNRNDLHPVPMACLPPELQDAAATWLDHQSGQIGATQHEMRSQVTVLLERKRSLITGAVTGEFDVSTASGRGVV